MTTEVNMTKDRPLWSVPVRLEDVPTTGRRFDLRADEAIRAAVARSAGIPEVANLEAVFEVSRHGPDSLHVVGHVSAAVRQSCVVTLEPVANSIEESVDLVFERGMPRADPGPDGPEDAAGEGPESLVDGTLDLGAVAVEFLMLGIDPYPRKPGAIFRAPISEDGGAGPFAALKKKSSGTTG
jgi:Large ribosomal RNA subunit accumulation protein YceD